MNNWDHYHEWMSEPLVDKSETQVHLCDAGYRRMDTRSLQGDEEVVNRRALIPRAAALICLVAGLTLLAGLVKARDVPEDTQAMNHASPAYLHVETADDLVTLETRDVPVKELLEEIARQYGLVLVLEDPLDDRLTMELDRLSLPQAMRRILRNHSFALQQVQALPGARYPSNKALSTLWVFSDDPEPPEGDHAASAVTSAIDALRIELMQGDAGRRLDAVQTLGAVDVDEVFAPEVIAPLSLALTDNDADVRLEAVSALVDVGTDQAAAALAPALGDADPSVREQAAAALGELGGPTAIQVLEQALMDPATEVREAAIAAFADIGGAESALALTVALNDEDVALREEVVDALGEIGGEIAIRLLEQALADPESSIRETAAEYLAELSTREQ